MRIISGNLNLRCTVRRERRAIQQAIRIAERVDTFFWYEKEMKKHGWKRHTAAYKVAYIKDGIVVKNGPRKQLMGEIRLWKESRGKFFRKNITRSFGILEFSEYNDYNGYYDHYRENGLLFQREVKRPHGSGCSDKCRVIADRLGIPDWWHNHGHDKNGEPVWFDTNLY